MRSKNQAHLVDFISRSRLLNSDRRTPKAGKNEHENVHTTLAVAKLMCCQFLFNLNGLEHRVFGFDDSQYAVYQPPTMIPLFTLDGGVNLEWFLDCVNFFREHMTNGQIGTMFDKFNVLEVTEKPSAWRGPIIQDVQPLSKNWKGTHAYLDHKQLAKLRSDGPNLYFDRNIDEGHFEV